jgi:hypothetical protein
MAKEESKEGQTRQESKGLVKGIEWGLVRMMLSLSSSDKLHKVLRTVM